jgi:hypothetical protein
MIVRGERSGSYTVVANEIINNSDIDWRDLGLLVFLLSKPDHWEVSTTNLANERKAGVDAIRTSLKALRDAGYVVMRKNSDGSVDYVIFDTPQVKSGCNEPKLEKPKQGKSLTGKKPNRENPALVITDIQQVNTEYTNNAREQSLVPDDFEIDDEVLARLFSSGVRREVAEFFLDEFVQKNISTGYVSWCWAAEFVSYCKKFEWRFEKYEQSRRGESGKQGVPGQAQGGFVDRLADYAASSG